MMAIYNSICTRNVALSILSGTGDIGIGTDTTNKTINIGSTSITSGVININTGTGGTINIGTSGNKQINIGNVSNTSAILIATGSGAINIGTSVAKTITIGNTTGATSVVINSGTGNIDIGTSIAKTISIGNTTSGTAININGNSGINIGTAAASTITIGSTSSSAALVFSAGNNGGIFFPFIEETTTSFTFVPGIEYIANNGSVITGTLPATVALGTIFSIRGQGSGGWTIAQNSGQTINSTAASTTTGTGGSLSSGGRYDSVSIICTVANTTFVIMNAVGTLNFV